MSYKKPITCDWCGTQMLWDQTRDQHSAHCITPHCGRIWMRGYGMSGGETMSMFKAAAEITALREQLAERDAEIKKLRAGDDADMTTAYMVGAEKAKDEIVALRAQLEEEAEEHAKELAVYTERAREAERELAAKDAEIAGLRGLLREARHGLNMAIDYDDDPDSLVYCIDAALANSNPSAVMDALRAAGNAARAWVAGEPESAIAPLQRALNNLPPHFKAALEGK